MKSEEVTRGRFRANRTVAPTEGTALRKAKRRDVAVSGNSYSRPYGRALGCIGSARRFLADHSGKLEERKKETLRLARFLFGILDIILPACTF